MKARRAIGWGAAVLVVALAAAVFLYTRDKQAQLELGVGYAARVACACRHIDNRPLAACYKDFEPGMEPIKLTEDASTKSVTASVPGIASRTVRFDPLLGCQPEPFKGRPHMIPR